MEFKKEHPLYFESSGRLVIILGRESISNPNIALLEVIKNSYDADAKEVDLTFKNLTKPLHENEVIIADDGNGMTEENIKQYWMKPATDNKLHDPFTKKYKRRKIGEKGIARFALSTLAKEITLTTKPAGKLKGYQLYINWREFEQEGGSFEKIPISFKSFRKKKAEHGTIIKLSTLRFKWNKERLNKFIREVEMITPPTAKVDNFKISVHVPDFPDISDQALKNKFLKIAPYCFTATLNKKGFLTYRAKTPKSNKKYGPEKTTRYSCGPVEFSFWFLPRNKGNYDVLGIDLKRIKIEEIKKFLDEWGGIKLYRDDLRVKPYGDFGNDWLGLESLRINDPSVMPGNDQVCGYVKITRKDNPEIIDTSTREGIINNVAFRDLKQFCTEAVNFFGTIRKVVEEKREFKKKGKRKKKIKELQKLTILGPKETFLDFGRKYPEVFYVRLESEINHAFRYNLPNASLMLARKMVENLAYNLMEEKFASNKGLRWDIKRDRPLGFARLIRNLSDNASYFDGEQKVLVKKLIKLINIFRREANLKVHQIIDYLEDKEELKLLKIPDIVEILLKLIRKNK
ncbi:MAG: ATP-binding protein [Candidatus Nealsonbacteria bacterium]